MKRSLWKLSIITTPEADDAVAELLQSQFDEPASSYTDVETGETTVTAYFAKQPKDFVKARREVLAGLARIKDCGLKIGRGKVALQKLRREDWAESWKRHFKPIEIGSVLLIKPSWNKRKPKKGQAVVVLDPGLSFGTGQHPTTSFCLSQIVEELCECCRGHSHSAESKSFLDIGTGSGILAIAAAKLGFAPIDAFDFDPEAVRIAQENARKNRVSGHIRIVRGDITKLPKRSAKKYDLVCANLISTLLIAERTRIVARLKTNGTLVLAGILKSEFHLVQEAYEALGFRLIASRVEKEWRSGAFARI